MDWAELKTGTENPGDADTAVAMVETEVEPSEPRLDSGIPLLKEEDEEEVERVGRGREVMKRVTVTEGGALKGSFR